MAESREIFSLFELNQAVREAVRLQLPSRYWIRAELSEVHPNRNGHCYLEFIEKDDSNRQIIAKSRGIVFANTYVLLKSYFEEQTGTAFSAGIKVLVSVSVDFSEVYGISLRVWDIDPNFTLGDMARKRAEIIRRLDEEGVLNLNKELEIPSVCQRIAVISSATAAGYGDFCNQLEDNAYGFVFYTKLFPAIMQGERTEGSIIEALEKIYFHADLFDVVVLIRGGGATSDLNSFDSYLLAANCAQFPLPIVSGIGHERDETVIDHVAHTRVKTPTAAAAFLIEQQARTLGELEFLQRGIAHRIQSLQQQRHSLLENLSQRLTYVANFKTKGLLSNLETMRTSLAVAVSRFSTGKKHELAMIEQYVELISPENVLRKGYALVLKNNKIVKSVNGIEVGDDLQVRMADGSVDVKRVER
ncbi:MAG: exodeoxyribonuclease VII large subunit [Bacteroidales bacterium 45-6]|nr:MAG: exodeoxyribonuclease VII large subunit [Bacteroidales bacterium 45-6]